MKEWVLLGRERERENESEFVSSVARHDEFEMGSHRIAFMMWYLVIKFDSNVCLADDDGGEEERKGSKTGWVSWGSNVANPTQQHGFLFLFNAIKSFAKVFSSTFLLICYIIRSFVISIFYIFYLSFAICLLVSTNSLSRSILFRVTCKTTRTNEEPCWVCVARRWRHHRHSTMILESGLIFFYSCYFLSPPSYSVPSSSSAHFGGCNKNFMIMYMHMRSEKRRREPQ